MMYTEVKIYEKVLWILNRACNENNEVENNEKHEIINKRVAGII